MGQYALVRNGVVVNIYGGLPGSFENVSGFNLMSDAEAFAYGFYPYTYTYPSYNGMIERIGSVEYTIGETSVTGVYPIIPLSAEQIAINLANYASQLISQLVQGLYNSDWSSLSDSGLDTSQKADYAALRLAMNSAIDAMTSYTAAEMDSIQTVLYPAMSDLSLRSKGLSSDLIALKTALDAL